jgi:hypothetical protein
MPANDIECDDLEAVATFILEHTGGNEAIVEHTMAEGLMSAIAANFASTSDSNQTLTALTTSANWSREES